MNYDFKQTSLSRCLLAGVLTGLIAIIADFIVFFSIGTSDVGTAYSLIINPFTIYFFNIIPAFIGGLLYSFLKEFYAGIILYMAFFLALSLILSYSCLDIHFTNDLSTEKSFHQLCISMIVIAGLLTSFVIP